MSALTGLARPEPATTIGTGWIQYFIIGAKRLSIQHQVPLAALFYRTGKSAAIGTRQIAAHGPQIGLVGRLKCHYRLALCGLQCDADQQTCQGTTRGFDCMDTVLRGLCPSLS